MGVVVGGGEGVKTGASKALISGEVEEVEGGACPVG